MSTGIKSDRRISRTKEAVNKAFLELFSEKAFEQITVNDIAERANVNRGTVYLHYKDKYDLLDQSIADHLNKLVTFCTGNDSHHGTTSLMCDLEPVFQYFRQNALFFSAMLANQRTSLFRERMIRFISASVKGELDGQHPDTCAENELNAQFMASAFVGVVEWWIQSGMPHSPEFMEQHLWKLFAGYS